ncbi:MAG: hypothetical protein AB1798_08770 [Spirochaetota bacterium]
MNKKIVLVIALVVLAAGISFAKGQAEDQSFPGSYPAAFEKVKATGKVYFKDTFFPELKTSDGKVYELMIPRYFTYSIDIKEGDEATVEGYLMPGPRWTADNDELYLQVVKAKVGGKEYDLGDFPGPGRGYMMWNYGTPGRGPMRGYGGYYGMPRGGWCW